jgi:hypothetical protein
MWDNQIAGRCRMRLDEFTIEDLATYRFGPYDVPHLGALCKRIREARSISGASMAKRCKARSTRTITQDFEVHNRLGPEYFERYVDSLQSRDMTLSPVTPNQAQMLTSWYGDRSDTALKERISQLASINFEDIHPNNSQRPRQLTDLVQQLSCERQPALIMDDLWFIHALNEAQLYMYNIAPEADFLHRWEGWHTIAGKVYKGSPVRQAHDESGQFIPPTIVFFFESPNTYPFLFTIQTRAFLSKLLSLSEDEQHDIHSWWPFLTAFTLPHNTPSVPRQVTINGSSFYTTPRIDKSRMASVKMAGSDHEVRYTLVTWEILDTSNEALRESLAATSPQKVYFAHDYDTNRDFHVNTWPTVEPLLKNWI